MNKKYRKKLLKERDKEDKNWRDRFQPGTMGCHEALHTVNMIVGIIDDNLCKHPAIVMNKEWYKDASKAAQLLADLYQKIGQDHM